MIPFTEKEKTIIAEFIHAIQTDTLTITECFDLVKVMFDHKLIDETTKDELNQKIKDKEDGIISLLKNTLTSTVSSEQGQKIMNEYYGIKEDQQPKMEEKKEDEKPQHERWGYGNRKDEKAFQDVMVGNQEYELFHGEFPHSRQDNSIYARSKNNPERIESFSGHRLPFKIEIEEYNYLKTSSLSGDEIRKGCTGKLFLNGKQIFECGGRNYERAYINIQRFIDDMELNWDWFPNKVDKEIGKLIKYEGQMFRIKSFIVSQACMIIETADGKPRKPFAYETEDAEEGDFDPETTVKVGITSPNIWWFPTKKEKEQYELNQ